MQGVGVAASLVLICSCASRPKASETAGVLSVRMDVSAVRQGAESVAVDVVLSEPAGAVLAAPRVVARIGEPATIEISGDPSISITVSTTAEGRLVRVDVEGVVRSADGREARPVASLTASWGIPSASGG
ncbi:MAG: hypothetical protein FJ257_08510 [Phycisphaerae bacterium]|nr:hypothetical protein [Phycisphaerae bacterium]